MTKKIVHGVMVLILLLVQLQSLVTARVAQASSGSSTVSQSIIANDDLSMTVDGVTSGETIEWTVTYEKKAAGYDRALKLRVSANENFDTQLTPIGQTAFHRMQAQGDDPDQQWWIEKEYAQSGNGTVKFTTPRAQNTVYVAAQLSQTTDDGNTDVLTGVDAAAHKVTLDTSVVDVPAEEVDVPATEEEAAATETAPEAEAANPETAAPAEDVTTEGEEESVIQTTSTNVIARFTAWNPVARAAGSATPADPFTYTNSPTSANQYPTYSTEYWSTAEHKDTVSNFNYGGTNHDGASTTAALPGAALNMDSGYHKYTDDKGMTVGYTKKTVSATLDPTKFNVQLDMIGEQIKPVPKVDVVLVIDRSNSMSYVDSNTDRRTRWQKLVAAVETFSESMLSSENDVQIGMVGFGTLDNSNQTRTPFAEIASFSPISSGTVKGFTDDVNALKGHELLRTYQGYFTPTYIGFETGLYLLSNEAMGAREGAHKVIITVTDGQANEMATNSYSSNGTQSLADSLLNSTKVGQTTRANNTVQRFYVNNSRYHTSSSASANTPGYVRNRLAQFPGVDAYSIGLYTGNDAANTLNALGPKGNHYAENAGQLIAALNAITDPYLRTIQNATVSDPMSDFVTLDRNSITKERLKVTNGVATPSAILPTETDYASVVDVTSTSNGINISNLTLGSDQGSLQGYRITYEVTLKAEYQDGHFYPTNGTTYLLNNVANEKDYLHFAVPSVRLESNRDIAVKKEWLNDQNDVYKLRQNVKMNLQEKTATGWTTIDSETLSESNNWTYTFTDLPQYANGSKIEYQVREAVVVNGVEQERVPGYYAPEYSSASANNVTTWTVKNTLKTASFGFTKYKVDTNTEWDDVKFRLERDSSNLSIGEISEDGGKVNFSGLAMGNYTLVEETPTGIKPVTHTVQVTDTEDGLSVTSTLGADNQFINEYKNFELTFIKTDSETGDVLQGAKFALKQGNQTLEETATGSDGKIVFAHELAPGDYVLEETEVPAGYLQLDADIHFTVNNNGTVTLTPYTGSDSADVQVNLEHELEDGDTLNQVTITASNIPERTILPRTGGPGIWGYVALATSLVFLAGGLMVHNRKSVKEGQ
ncbi:vWA domain-containing protein [Lacticaseibacillus mingshuiensis]|uniref:vWA domain-containing protein n=1 Tax=Lacticaseibacillus mingshuiensis TaxID=2799574 RepID=UPI0019500CBE|nr:vWA domain-containing protein [Lacticaseibacillus mingshuiensis]